MYINKPSVAKLEAVDRVNLLYSTRCGFKQYQSSKPDQMLVSLPRYPPFHDSYRKTPAFRDRN